MTCWLHGHALDVLTSAQQGKGGEGLWTPVNSSWMAGDVILAPGVWWYFGDLGMGVKETDAEAGEQVAMRQSLAAMVLKKSSRLPELLFVRAGWP